MPASPSHAPRIGLVTAMWQRPALTRLVFRHVARLREELAGEMEIVPAAAGSEGDESRKIAEECGFLYAEVPNAPLGAKWNAALGILRDRNVDGVCIFGSDDLANAAWFRLLRKHVDAGADRLGVRGMHFFDQPTGRLVDWGGYLPPKEGDTPGAGRFLHRRILDAVGWKLWPDMAAKGLDGLQLAGLKERFGPDFVFVQMPCREAGAVIVDVKCELVMSSIERLMGVGNATLVGDPHAFFIAHFGEDLADALLPAGVPRLAGEDFPLDRGWDAPAPPAAASGVPAVFCIRPADAPLPATTHDFALACGSAGLPAFRISPQDFLRRPPSDAEIAHISSPDSTSLLCAMRGRHAIFDLRGWPEETREMRAFLHRLPVALLGAPERRGAEAVFLPAPMHAPGRTLPFDRRANLLACLKEPRLMEEMSAAWLSSNLLQRGIRLFLLGSSPINAFQNVGIYFFLTAGLPAARQIFRVAICVRETWPSAAIPFASGTPVICVGPPPAEMGADSGLIGARSFEEALAIAEALHADANLWERASRQAVEFAGRGRKAFAGALRRFISVPR